jgi:hypothetical protein
MRRVYSKNNKNFTLTLTDACAWFSTKRAHIAILGRTVRTNIPRTIVEWCSRAAGLTVAALPTPDCSRAHHHAGGSRGEHTVREDFQTVCRRLPHGNT